MITILKHAADRGEVRSNIPPRVATLPTDLFRHELFLTRTPPPERVIIEIVDDVFLPFASAPLRDLAFSGSGFQSSSPARAASSSTRHLNSAPE